MAINPYTLNSLYGQGILDYVPYDLCGGANVSALNGMQNPYLNMAAQGGLYQNAGNSLDTFNAAGMNTQIGGGEEKYGFNQTGFSSPQGGTSSNGFRNLSNKFNSAVSSVSNAPNFVKGLVSVAILLGTLIFCFKGKKKPPVVEKQSLFSKLLHKKNK